MLVLTRKINQSIELGDGIRVIVLGIDRDQVKLGIDAPKDVAIKRAELEKHSAAQSKRPGSL